MKSLLAFFLMLKAMLRPLKKDVKAVINLSVVLMIGIAFAALVVIAFIIWTIQAQLVTPSTSSSANASIANITSGFDNAIALLLVAITIFIWKIREFFNSTIPGVISTLHISFAYATWWQIE